MKELKITSQNKGQRLDKFLLKFLNKGTKAFVYKMLRKKNIKLNGKKATGNEILKNEDIVTLYLADDTINKFRTVQTNYRQYKKLDVRSIVLEDENILIINKNQGVAVHSSTSDEGENTLINSVINHLIENKSYDVESSVGFRPAVCNRLDVNTSGLVTVGKNLETVQQLNEMFKTREVDKYYITIVVGKLEGKKRLEGYHNKNNDTNEVVIRENSSGKEGEKKVITEYEVLKNNDNYSLVRVKLITGRSHQIRAHLKLIGHPIIGDRKYGDTEENKKIKQKYGLSNQLLHGEYLKFKENKGILKYLGGRKIKALKPEIFRKIELGIFKK